MLLAISTHWNVCRHRSGESLVEEILQTGINRLELGYDLTQDLVPGIRRMVAEKRVTIASVHNYCPVPLLAPMGHPELFLLASPRDRLRADAVAHTARTIEFASDMGASTVVVHAGYVRTRNLSAKALALVRKGQREDPAFERLRLKMIAQRADKAQPHIAALTAALNDLLPLLRKSNVRLAIENLPSWESVPTLQEMEFLVQQFEAPWIGYWHDVGHAHTRQNLGFDVSGLWLDRLRPRLLGMHIHDVRPPSDDHLAPGQGNIDFTALKPYANGCPALVLEPAPGMPIEELRRGIRTLRTAWGLPEPTEGLPA